MTEDYTKLISDYAGIILKDDDNKICSYCGRTIVKHTKIRFFDEIFLRNVTAYDCECGYEWYSSQQLKDAIELRKNDKEHLKRKYYRWIGYENGKYRNEGRIIVSLSDPEYEYNTNRCKMKYELIG